MKSVQSTVFFFLMMLLGTPYAVADSIVALECRTSFERESVLAYNFLIDLDKQSTEMEIWLSVPKRKYTDEEIKIRVDEVPDKLRYRKLRESKKKFWEGIKAETDRNHLLSAEELKRTTIRSFTGLRTKVAPTTIVVTTGGGYPSFYQINRTNLNIVANGSDFGKCKLGKVPSVKF